MFIYLDSRIARLALAPAHAAALDSVLAPAPAAAPVPALAPAPARALDFAPAFAFTPP